MPNEVYRVRVDIVGEGIYEEVLVETDSAPGTTKLWNAVSGAAVNAVNKLHWRILHEKQLRRLLAKYEDGGE